MQVSNHPDFNKLESFAMPLDIVTELQELEMQRTADTTKLDTLACENADHLTAIGDHKWADWAPQRPLDPS